jgi:hypothetical protein
MDNVIKLEERIRSLELLAEKQGWVLQSNGKWETKHDIADRQRMEQLCSYCKYKEKDCVCCVCMSCARKDCKNDCN